MSAVLVCVTPFEQQKYIGLANLQRVVLVLYVRGYQLAWLDGWRWVCESVKVAGIIKQEWGTTGNLKSAGTTTIVQI